MAAITSFPDVLPVGQGVYGDDLIFTATEKIIQGQLVTLANAGTISVATSASTNIIGSALTDILAGYSGTVRVNGIIEIANGDGATAINAGSLVGAGALGGGILAVTGKPYIGIAIDQIAGGGLGRVAISNGVV